jgi:DNA recombination protein RmuC
MDMGLTIVVFLFGGIVGAGIGGLGVYVIWSNRQRAELLRLTERATQAEANLEAERRASNEKIAALQEAETRLRDVFGNLSNQALQQNTKHFLTLVKQQLDQQQQNASGGLTQHKQEITALLEPLKTSLTQQQQAITAIERSRQQAYGSIEEQLKGMAEDQRRLQAETANLVTALRQPHVRGRWGEIQLQRVVELAGMQEYCDFTQQQGSSGVDGNQQRPDMLVHLPNKRHIVVDAKVPFSAYLEALEASDAATRKEKLKSHAKQIRTHIDQMNKRSYHQAIDGSHDFTVLFIPGEVFYSAALEHDHELLEYGFGKRIIITTPTTLIALLKAVALGWHETRLTANAELIKQYGEEIYKRLNTVVSHMVNLGKTLDKSVEHYNSVIGSMERNLLTSARRMHELQIGDDDLADLEPLDRTSRQFSKPELLPQPDANNGGGTGGE